MKKKVACLLAIMLSASTLFGCASENGGSDAYHPRHHHPVHRPGLTVQNVHLPVQSLTAPRRDRLVQALKLSFPPQESELRARRS